MWHEFQLKPLYYVTWQNLLSFQCNCHSFCLFFFHKKRIQKTNPSSPSLHLLVSLTLSHFYTLYFSWGLVLSFSSSSPPLFSVLNMKRKQNGNSSEFLSILVIKRKGRKRRTESNLLNGKTSWRQDRKRIKKRGTKMGLNRRYNCIFNVCQCICCFVAFFIENLTSFFTWWVISVCLSRDRSLKKFHTEVFHSFNLLSHAYTRVNLNFLVIILHPVSFNSFYTLVESCFTRLLWWSEREARRKEEGL